MQFTDLKTQVCQCGSHSCSQNHQIQVIDLTQDYGRRWTTKKERDENPSLVISKEQHCLWVSDPTWYTCWICKAQLDPEVCTAVIKEAFGGKSIMEIPWFETIGPGIINAKAIERVNLK